MIYVTVGTGPQFERLIRKVDEIAPKLGHEVVMQTGTTKYKPKNAKHFDFCPPDIHQDYWKKADLVVGHAGAGIILDAIINQTRVILVPRRKKYGEVVHDHQLDHIEGWKRRTEIKVVHDVDELSSILTDDLEKIPIPKPMARENRLVTELRKAIIQLGTKKK